MDNIDFVFSEAEYDKLNREYSKQLVPDISRPISCLNGLVEQVEKNSFQMPLTLQNKILNNLLSAKQILNILHRNNTIESFTVQNNPFTLIEQLSTLTLELNHFTLKSPYQVLSLKAVNILLKAIKQISYYFSNKKLKIFKFN